MKYYKAPRGFNKVADEPHPHIEDGAIVYIEPPYVAEDESPRRMVVMEMSKGYYLIADNKRMYNKGEGYIFSLGQIAYYKNPQ